VSDYITDFVIFREVTDWKEVRKDFLRPEIRSVQEYNRELRNGVERASKYLEGCQTVPSVRELETAHRLMFERLYTDAGRLRLEGKQSEIEGQKASPGEEVAKHLADLEKNSRRDFARRGIEERLQTACLHHAGMEMIRPFESGNEEISRLVLADQLRKEFGGEAGRNLDELDKRAYVSALNQARTLGQEGSTLVPLKVFTTDFSRQTLQVEAERVEKKMQQAVAELEYKSKQVTLH